MNKDTQPKLHVVGADPRENINETTASEEKEPTLWEYYKLSQKEFAEMVSQGHQEFVEILEKSVGEAATADNVLRYLTDSNRSEAARAAILLVLINNSNELYETKQLLGRLLGPIVGDAIGPALQQISTEIGGIKQFITNSVKKT